MTYAKSNTTIEQPLELTPTKVKNITCTKALKEELLPSNSIPEICSFRRGHGGRGELTFLKEYLLPKLKALSLVINYDDFGNIYVQVGKFTPVLHVGHIDTVHSADDLARQAVTIDDKGILTLDSDRYLSSTTYSQSWAKDDNCEQVTRMIASLGTYKPPKQKTKIPTCLGADDGVAIAIMLYLIAHKVEGTYLFTRGEEVGCLGSGYIVNEHPSFLQQFDMAIQVDRKGKEEIIIEQSTGKCASKVYGEALAEALDMKHKVSFKGVITDTGHMNHLIPECVNLAAGYYKQHGSTENTCLKYADELAEKMLAVNWAQLPISRDVEDTVSEAPKPKYTPPAYGGFYDDNLYGGYYSGRNSETGKFTKASSTHVPPAYTPSKVTPIKSEVTVKTNLDSTISQEEWAEKWEQNVRGGSGNKQIDNLLYETDVYDDNYMEDEDLDAPISFVTPDNWHQYYDSYFEAYPEVSFGDIPEEALTMTSKPADEISYWVTENLSYVIEFLVVMDISPMDIFETLDVMDEVDFDPRYDPTDTNL